MRFLLFSAALGYGTLIACEERPCDRYIDYICVCHENDPEFDCDELFAVLNDADQNTQDQCAIDLSEQQEQDRTDGLTCDLL